MACGFRDLLLVGAFTGTLVAGHYYKEGKPVFGGDRPRPTASSEKKVEESQPTYAASYSTPVETPALTLPRFPKLVDFKASGKATFDKPGHSIPDTIYGVCSLPVDKLEEFALPITRWGGNTSTRYNWKNNAHNCGKDWFYFNRGERIVDVSNNTYLRQIRTNQSIGATTYTTIPMLGWVAKDNCSSSYSVQKYGKQQRVEPWNSDVGNGILENGKVIRDNDPRDTSIEASPEFVAEAVSLAVRHAGPAQPASGKKGVAYWVLDNEPMLWHETHADVRKDAVSCDELWERTVAYAEAIKRADPTAKVAGFCSWGWVDLFYSAKDKVYDNYQSRPDFTAHGSIPLAEWFIQKCGDYKKKNGKSLVDVFDFHWYPQCKHGGKNPYEGKGSNLAFNELRLRATRDLWDPEYEQESWCRNAGDRQPTALIRRVHSWIEKHNPGMEIAIGEYNFGGADNISGALAQADVFGIMAREKVDLGFIWSSPEGSQILAWKLFRNYDGKGGRFGDEYVPATADRDDVAVYAARRSKDGAKTILVLNKNLTGSCSIKLDVPQVKGKMRVWQFDQDGEVVEVVKESAAINEKISMTVPAGSATMLVIE
jgi:hypothetical protein